VFRAFPPPLPPAASDADRLRYLRHWAIVGVVLGAPVWVLVFAFVKGEGAKIIFAVIAALTVLNIVSLTLRIERAKRR
jgi:hypothetical protein